MAELRETVEIVNQRGLHSISVKVHKDGNEANGGSILGLMMLGAAKGDTIEIVASGEGAEVVMPKIVGLVLDGFGED